MPRIKMSVARLKRKRRILGQAKGYFGRRKNMHKTAKEAVERRWRYAYRDRRVKKREFRQLWISRLSAAAVVRRRHDRRPADIGCGPCARESGACVRFRA